MITQEGEGRVKTMFDLKSNNQHFITIVSIDFLKKSVVKKFIITFKSKDLSTQRQRVYESCNVCYH